MKSSSSSRNMDGISRRSSNVNFSVWRFSFKERRSRISRVFQISLAQLLEGCIAAGRLP